MAATQESTGRTITFGHHDEAEFRLLETRQHMSGMSIRSEIAGHELKFEMQMHGSHWAQNALGVLACVDALGLNIELAAASLATCPTPKGRGTRFSGHYQHCAITVIDDSYNASPASMTAAFGSMKLMPPTIMILSDMLELGATTKLEHDILMPHINALAPRLVVALGPAMQKAISGLDKGILGFAADCTNTAVEIINAEVKEGDIIFIKGSLGSGAWRVCDTILTKLAIHESPDMPSHNGEDSSCLIYLCPYLTNFSHLTFSLHNFRTGGSTITALLIALLFDRRYSLVEGKSTGQPIRMMVLNASFNKGYTPTMGVILIAFSLSTLLRCLCQTHISGLCC